MKRSLLALGSAAAVLSLTACGGGGGGSSAASASSASASATPPVAAAAGPASAADATQAQAWLQAQLNETYGAAAANTPAAAEPEAANESAAQFIEREARDNARVYTPEMVALMRRDRLSTPEGMVGVLDYQPFCGCNDDSLIRVSGVTATPRPDGRVDAVAQMTSGSERLTRNFVLERTAAGWRIADVNGLLADLQRGVPEQEAAMRAPARPAA